jgi:phosphoglucomutase
VWRSNFRQGASVNEHGAQIVLRILAQESVFYSTTAKTSKEVRKYGMTIKFGTSGWRAVIADEFTFANLTLVLEAIACYLKQNHLSEKGIIIGRDTRFGGEDFAQYAARLLASEDLKVFLCERDVPTPVISYEIRRRKAGGGINFTASHNPPEYQGLKFSTSDGAPALPEITQQFEQTFAKLYAEEKANPRKRTYPEFQTLLSRGKIELIDPNPPYLQRLREIVDTKVIAESGIKVIYDAMYGTARGYTDKFLKDLGVSVETLHDYRDVYFGGRPPEPSEKNIPELIARVKEQGAKGEFVIGIANDGDADRYAVVDSTGTYLQANQLLAILFHYALKHKPWRGCVVRTLATTHLIDAIANKEGIKLYDVPVGFKYIGEIMMREDMIVGGEESNGLSVYQHIPEPPTSIAGKNVVKLDKRDGVKMICEDESWLLVRFSGTEPVVRFYAEAHSEARTQEMIHFAKSLI